MNQRAKILVAAALGIAAVQAQTQAPNVYNVLSWSSVFNQTVFNNSGKPVGLLNQAVPNVFAYGGGGTSNAPGGAYPMNTMQVDTSIVRVNNAVNSSVATALGLIPLASPASGLVFHTDPATGLDLPATSTLGGVLTERGETIGKHKWYLGFTHDDFHFTQLNGQSLNALQVLYQGGTQSAVNAGTAASPNLLKSYPATFDIGMDVRLSQDVAFLTYGITDRLDVSLGLPVVHSAVAARTFNGVLYDGDGLAGQVTSGNVNCWCAGTFNPGYYVSPYTNFTLPNIGQSSLGKTGFGDLLVRAKGTVVHNSRLALAVGADLRFATGDAQNYLGTGATSIKPFGALSVYLPVSHGIVFAPHLNLGWQFSGKSVLGGQLQPNVLNATMSDGSGTVQYYGAPLTATKGYLPDVFSWALGTEVAFGRRNTLVVDILSNDIGWIHGAPNLTMGAASGVSPLTLQNETVTGLTAPGSASTATGLAGAIPTTAYSQYSGSFGYKARLIGNLVFTFNALVRFDSNGLTARFAPLYGLGYSF